MQRTAKPLTAYAHRTSRPTDFISDLNLAVRCLIAKPKHNIDFKRSFLPALILVNSDALLGTNFGNIAVMSSIAMVPILIFTNSAVDYPRGSTVFDRSSIKPSSAKHRNHAERNCITRSNTTDVSVCLSGIPQLGHAGNVKLNFARSDDA